ncbi:sugar ABC transporter substrate-binding protein [uncultured Sphaerochaeta sp.]|uniref:ABC transporter substrate-binding protein n=1 Tax=uncultured Sphaerochaeta sp. TaxID=886478 RepID=UPI002AA6164B|nr:sugar ABC transporter substrate-binding protein [uncultured Sphaerochaeta sp.]
MKKDWKRLIVACLLFALVGTAVFAAGEAEKQVEQKTINFWYWDQNGEEVYQQMIAEFEADNPSVSVKMSIIPWSDYWTKLQMALPTGTGPDIFWLNHPNAVSYLPTGLVMNLESEKDSLHFENFNSIYYEPFMYEGERYGVPIFFDSVIMYYNKAMFDAAGLAYPDDTWTWDDYFNAAAKLTIKDGDTTIQYGTIADPDMQSGASNFILQNGGKLFSDDGSELVIDSKEGREASQFLIDMIYKYGYSPKVSEMREITKATMFQSGMVAMITNHTGILKQFAEVLGKDMGIAPMPMQKQRASIYHNLGYVASAKTKHPEEVKKFLAYLASKRHAEILSKVWAPCYTGGAELFFEEYNWLDIDAIIDTVNYGYPLPISSKNAGPVYTLLNNEMDKVFMQPSLGDGLSKVEDVVNAEINK